MKTYLIRSRSRSRYKRKSYYRQLSRYATMTRYTISTYSDASLKVYEVLDNFIVLRITSGICIKTTSPHKSLQNGYCLTKHDLDLVGKTDKYMNLTYHNLVYLTDKKYGVLFSEALAMLWGIKNTIALIINSNIRNSKCVLHTDNAQLFNIVTKIESYFIKLQQFPQLSAIMTEINNGVKKLECLTNRDVAIRHTLVCDENMKTADYLSRKPMCSDTDLEEFRV